MREHNTVGWKTRNTRNTSFLQRLTSSGDKPEVRRLDFHFPPFMLCRCDYAYRQSATCNVYSVENQANATVELGPRNETCELDVHATFPRYAGTGARRAAIGAGAVLSSLTVHLRENLLQARLECERLGPAIESTPLVAHCASSLRPCTAIETPLVRARAAAAIIRAIANVHNSFAVVRIEHSGHAAAWLLRRRHERCSDYPAVSAAANECIGANETQAAGLHPWTKAERVQALESWRRAARVNHVAQGPDAQVSCGICSEDASTPRYVSLWKQRRRNEVHSPNISSARSCSADERCLGRGRRLR